MRVIAGEPLSYENPISMDITKTTHPDFVTVFVGLFPVHGTSRSILNINRYQLIDCLKETIKKLENPEDEASYAEFL